MSLRRKLLTSTQRFKVECYTRFVANHPCIVSRSDLKRSPELTMISFPSELHTAIRPERTYPIWAAESLPVCPPTCRDHRHPGRYSPRPIVTDSRTTAARLLPSRNVHVLSARSMLFAKGFMYSLYLRNPEPRGIWSEIAMLRQSPDCLSC